ncbi:MAG: hypothetical protein JWP69_2292 [Flaviaesturariibacter sp.]|nr:hypothetical protein [Flaviaesturariibacter sp.]
MADKASRLLRIYSRLRRSPVTIEIIKDWAMRSSIDVSERQLYRDLKEIEASINLEGEKVIVFEGEKNRKTWKIEFQDSKDAISLFDINTFYLLKNFAPLTLVHARENALLKFESLLYRQMSHSPYEKNSLANLEGIKSSHFYETPYQNMQHQLLEDCIWAIQNQRKFILNQIAFDHTSLGAAIKFPILFLPLRILYHRGCIHLCGLEEATKKLMILALEQIIQYETTNDMFDASLFIENMEVQLGNRFGVTENMENRVYAIQIEFSKLTGDFVKNHFWHHSQQFDELENGNWIMNLHCGINRELVGWIFQWMSNAKVHQPLVLKELVENRLRDTLQLYTGEKGVYSNNVFRPA